MNQLVTIGNGRLTAIVAAKGAELQSLVPADGRDVMWTGDEGAMTASDLALLARLRLASERGELSLVVHDDVEDGSELRRGAPARSRITSRA